MAASEFIEYYEILEISPNANSGTIDRVFRYLAQLYHPDNRETGDRFRFDVIVEAHNTLKDPLKRAQYDIAHKCKSKARPKLVEEAGDGRRRVRYRYPEQAPVAALCQMPAKRSRARYR
jgi:curved DNA-binding protein CbpA